MTRTGAIGISSLAVMLAGCSVSTSSFSDGSTAAGAIVGSLSTAPAVAAPPPAVGAFLEGPVGTRLGDADREKAYQAELDAVEAGDRKTWRGTKGNFGFVAINGPETADGCRAFSHTVYLSGRPQTGKGTGCRQPDGSWRVTG